ncbi:MAG: radical SAM protein [Bacteroidales bacterium]|jgi:cyclic pyranopterin phosphate synthase|nr:radical SAM protein [Bacteroidales bacterium]
MYDRFNRKINYLRVSVTDRCNLRCVYCMPEDGIQLIDHKEILTFGEIVDVIMYSVSNGVDKVRLTGGEPLVRKGIVDLVAMIAKIDGIKDFGLTTNGILLEEMAQPLADAGLHRVNISLDTMDANKYRKITRLGDINKVFKGIVAAKKAGLLPIKINCVINNSHDEPDAQAVAKFCKENDLQIRYIHVMDLEKGEFSAVEGGTGGDCKICNRLRLTAKGDIMPCLFSNIGYNVRELGIENAIDLAVRNKPRSGHHNSVGKFYNIGG